MNAMKKNRNAQIQMGETIAVLFIFFILLILGVSFYVRVHSTTIRQEIDEKSELDAVDLAQKISFLPELMCTSKNTPLFETNCIDLYKLQAFNSLVEGDGDLQLSYFDEFGYSHIHVAQIYPEPEPDAGYTVYERQKPDFANNITTWIPVSLYNPAGDNGEEIYFGVLVVEVFS